MLSCLTRGENYFNHDLASKELAFVCSRLKPPSMQGSDRRFIQTKRQSAYNPPINNVSFGRNSHRQERVAIELHFASGSGVIRTPALYAKFARAADSDSKVGIASTRRV